MKKIGATGFDAVCKGNIQLKYTGERFISGGFPKWVVDEHVERYRFAANFVKGKLVLDIACGVGYGSKVLAEAGALRVDGVDISQDAVDHAKHNYQSRNISFKTGDICSYKANTAYDVITCFETIEHIDDYQLALSNLYSLSDDNGLLFISSPNRPVTSPDARDLNDKSSNKYHVREFTIEELKSALIDHGFFVEESDIFGQRHRMHFSNKYLRKIHTMLFKPNRHFSPVVSRKEGLMPLYFLIIARKAQ